MEEWLLLKNNINRLLKTLIHCFIIDIRTRRISKMERRIEKLKRDLDIETKVYKDYLLETKTIVESIRKECE